MFSSILVHNAFHWIYYVIVYFYPWITDITWVKLTFRHVNLSHDCIAVYSKHSCMSYANTGPITSTTEFLQFYVNNVS